MSLLERRLDNVVHRLGWGSPVPPPQMVCHGHITVNGKRVDISSYEVRVGDVIGIKERKSSLELVQASLAESSREVPEFLVRVDGRSPKGMSSDCRGGGRLDSDRAATDRRALLEVIHFESSFNIIGGFQCEFDGAGLSFPVKCRAIRRP